MLPAPNASLLAFVVSLSLISTLGVVAPAASSADSQGLERHAIWALTTAEATRSRWETSGAFERAARPRVVLSTARQLHFRYDASFSIPGLVRFARALPVQMVQIGPEPRLPRESDPVRGLVFVYRFDPL